MPFCVTNAAVWPGTGNGEVLPNGSWCERACKRETPLEAPPAPFEERLFEVRLAFFIGCLAFIAPREARLRLAMAADEEKCKGKDTAMH